MFGKLFKRSKPMAPQPLVVFGQAIKGHTLADKPASRPSGLVLQNYRAFFSLPIDPQALKPLSENGEIFYLKPVQEGDGMRWALENQDWIVGGNDQLIHGNDDEAREEILSHLSPGKILLLDDFLGRRPLWTAMRAYKIPIEFK